MKADLSSLNASVLQVLAARPPWLANIVQVRAVRNEAPRRSGASPSQSADITINERTQALRRSGKIVYDQATGRWEVSPPPATVPLPPLASTGIAPPTEGDMLPVLV